MEFIPSIKIGDTVYSVGDKVCFMIGDEIRKEGFVTFGAFYAEIYTVYGFYVADENGNQVSEAGLDDYYIKV